MKATAMLLLFTVFSAGCATMTDGRFQDIPVRSDPSGAGVRLICGPDSSNQGETPVTISVPRTSDPCSITVSKDGFVPKNIPLARVTRFIPGDVGLAFAFGGVGGLALFIPIAMVTAKTERDWGRAYSIGFALTAPIPFFIDAHTGGLYQHVPSDIYVTLAPAQP
jgi:hypothetical protein